MFVMAGAGGRQREEEEEPCDGQPPARRRRHASALLARVITNGQDRHCSVRGHAGGRVFACVCYRYRKRVRCTARRWPGFSSLPRPVNAAALAAAALAAAWVCERNVPGRLHLRWPHLHLRVSQDAVGERIRPTRSGLTIDQCRLDCCNRARCIGFDHDSGTSSDGTGKCWASATSWAAKPLIDWTRPNSHRWACEAFVPPPPLPPSPPPPPLPVNVAVYSYSLDNV